MQHAGTGPTAAGTADKAAADAAEAKQAEIRSSSEGVESLHAAGETVMADLAVSMSTLKGINELKRLADEARRAIEMDVFALNNTMQEEYANIQTLQRFEKEQNQVLKSQLSYLLPDMGSSSSNISGMDTEGLASHMQLPSADAVGLGKPGLAFSSGVAAAALATSTGFALVLAVAVAGAAVHLF